MFPISLYPQKSVAMPCAASSKNRLQCGNPSSDPRPTQPYRARRRPKRVRRAASLGSIGANIASWNAPLLPFTKLPSPVQKLQQRSSLQWPRATVLVIRLPEAIVIAETLSSGTCNRLQRQVSSEDVLRCLRTHWAQTLDRQWVMPTRFQTGSHNTILLEPENRRWAASQPKPPEKLPDDLRGCPIRGGNIQLPVLSEE